MVKEIPEQVFERKLLHPSLERFQGYIASHKGKIEEAHRQGKSYADIFYDQFYSEDFEDPYMGRPPQMQSEIIRIYNENVAAVEKRLTSRITKDSVLKDAINPGWIQMRMNGGVEKGREKLSRLYLNVRPEIAPSLFQALLEKGELEGMRFEAKINSTLSEEEAKRFEKIVVYYPDQDHDAMIEFVAKFHDSWKQYFQKGSPEFSAQVGHFETGKILPGIGFAEDPSGGQSFGEVRSQILADLYEEASRQGLSISDPGFNLGVRFAERCDYYGVDADRPAFNKAA